MLGGIMVAVCAFFAIAAISTGERGFKVLWLLGLVAFCATAPAKAEDLQSIPEFESYLVDKASWLSSQENLTLRKKLEGVKSAGKVQIAVLIVDSTKPEAIEQYSIRVAEKWKVGKKGVDNGVLVIVAKQDKKMRIDVGYGLEGTIPDAIAKRIIVDDMAPFLKKGKPYDALNFAVDRIVEHAQKEGAVQPGKAEAPADTASKETVADKDGGLTGIDMVDSHPGGALVLAIVLAVLSAICFFIEEGGVILTGIAIPFIGGGVVGIPFFGFATAVAIAIGALVLAVVIRFGLEIGGAVISGGGSFGGGGASGGWD